MLSTKLKGAFRLITNTMFYGKDGKVSFTKCAISISAIWYFCFFNPIALAAIGELALWFIVCAGAFKIGKAFINGDLDRYAGKTHEEVYESAAAL